MATIIIKIIKHATCVVYIKCANTTCASSSVHGWQLLLLLAPPLVILQNVLDGSVEPAVGLPQTIERAHKVCKQNLAAASTPLRHLRHCHKQLTRAQVDALLLQNRKPGIQTDTSWTSDQYKRNNPYSYIKHFAVASNEFDVNLM